MAEVIGAYLVLCNGSGMFLFPIYCLINTWYYILICLITPHFPNFWPFSKYKKGLSLRIYKIFLVSKLMGREWGTLYSCCVQQNRSFASRVVKCITISIVSLDFFFFYIGRMKEWNGYGLHILLITTSETAIFR